MISVSGKKWIERKVNKNIVEKISQDFNFSAFLSKLIVDSTSFCCNISICDSSSLFSFLP